MLQLTSNCIVDRNQETCTTIRDKTQYKNPATALTREQTIYNWQCIIYQGPLTQQETLALKYAKK